MDVFEIFEIIFPFILILVVYMGIVEPLLRKARCKEKVTAVIVEYSRHLQSQHNGYWYNPIYEYTYYGDTYRVKAKNESKTAPEKLGEEVTIYINPNKPQEIYAENELSKTRIPFTDGFVLFSLFYAMLYKIFF